MTEQQKPIGPWEAKCYYVKDQKTGWWAYFTITPAIGLLQIFGDWGTFTDNFADRWSAPGPDFRRFLINAETSYIGNAIETTAAQYDDRASWRKSVQRRIAKMMLHLWPLFIERLKAEQAGGSEPG